MSRKITMPTKEELECVYQNTRSISKTAKHFSTSNPTIRKWLCHYSISRYSHKEAVRHDFLLKKVPVPPKEELETFIADRSISDIRSHYNIGQQTFYEWLEYYNITQVSFGEKVSRVKGRKFFERFPQTKEELEDDYKKIQCMGGLAQMYDCSVSTIKKLFNQHNIEAIFPKMSKGQLEVDEFIRSLGFSTELNNRKIIAPNELDILVPDKKIAVEYCGVFFHSETYGGKARSYHRDKLLRSEAAGYTLITIFDSEWITKKEIVKSILKAKLGVIENKISARKTKFKELSYKDVKDFEEDNHLQGTRSAGKYYGLFYDNELIMSLSIGKSRFNKKVSNELIRMTTKKDCLVVGGLSKLVKNIGLEDCLTYADRRYGNGIGYGQVGFVRQKDSAPNYFYFKRNQSNILHSRNKFQKHKISGADTSKTEYENMLDLGYERIWDCGNAVYIL